MAQAPDVQIRDHVARFLSGKDDLDTFKQWFVSSTWQPKDAPASDLAGEIDLALMEHSSGHASVDDLKQLLRPLVQAPATR